MTEREKHVAALREILENDFTGMDRPEDYAAEHAALIAAIEALSATAMLIRLHCPTCHELHIDTGEFATKPHHTHACQNCGAVWRPAIVATVGVQFLPGFKDDAP